MSGASRRVCLFAQFHPRHRIRSNVVSYVKHLQECGYQTVVAVSGDRLPPAEDREALRATGAQAVFRPNLGLDFGAWAHLVREGYAEGADEVLLANDSVFGPFTDLRPIIAKMRAKRLDVWGMIESLQHRWHLQSWFLNFTQAAFNAPQVQAIFALPFDSMTKGEIIARGELGLGEALQQSGLRCGAVVRHRDGTWLARRYAANMMHLDWRYNLTSRRLPFLKADLLRVNMMNIPWVNQWDDVLRTKFGVDTKPIHDFLYEYTGRRRASPDQPFVSPIGKQELHVVAGYVLMSHDHRPAFGGLLRLLGSGTETNG